VKGGLDEGDQVIRYPTRILKDGQPIQAARTRQVERGRASATGK
jgi:hypothetical protein